MNFLKGSELHQAIRICVDSVKDNMIFSGKIDTESSVEEISFYDIQNLILEIEVILNDGIHPDAGKNLRRFKKISQTNKKDINQMNNMERAKIIKKEGKTDWKNLSRGKIATVILYITQRRNATWQGRVYSLETGKVVNFKSELEFLENFVNIVKASDDKQGILETAL